MKLFILSFVLCMYGATSFTGPVASKIYRDSGFNTASYVAIMSSLEQAMNDFNGQYTTNRPLLKSYEDESGVELTEIEDFLDLNSDGPRVTAEPNGQGGWITVVKDGKKK